MSQAIKIKEPRYKDMVVLVARYRIPCGKDFNVEIEKGSYKGLYKVSNEVVCKSAIDSFKTKQGKTLSVRAIKIDDLVRIEE